MFRKKKSVAILVIFIILSIFVTAIGAYYWSSDNDDYQMLLNTEPPRQPENVGKTIYEVKSSKEYGWVDPSLQNNVLSNANISGNFTADEKQVMQALIQLWGKFDQQAIAKFLSIPNDINAKTFYYTMIPAICEQMAFNVPAGMSMAQSIYEAGRYFKSPSWKWKNLHGVKGWGKPNKYWKGKIVRANTTEYYASGEWHGPQPWRAYDTYYDAFMDHGRMLATQPNYKKARVTQQSSVDGYVQALKRGQYFTCSLEEYDQSVGSIYRRNHLERVNKLADQIKNILANVSGSVAGNSATGKPGEWKPTGSTSAMQKAGVNISKLTNDQGAVLSEAFKYIGLPYVWGGTTPKGFDCSGFTQWVYKHALGISIGRNTYAQINAGVEVSRKDLQPGDLVFPSDHHVTIYIGNGKVIHSPQTGECIKVSPMWAFWRARRIIGHG